MLKIVFDCNNKFQVVANGKKWMSCKTNTNITKITMKSAKSNQYLSKYSNAYMRSLSQHLATTIVVVALLHRQYQNSCSSPISHPTPSFPSIQLLFHHHHHRISPLFDWFNHRHRRTYPHNPKQHVQTLYYYSPTPV